jgi:hypothetical protein
MKLHSHAATRPHRLIIHRAATGSIIGWDTLPADARVDAVYREGHGVVEAIPRYGDVIVLRVEKCYTQLTIDAVKKSS